MKKLFKILGILSFGVVIVSCNSGTKIYTRTVRVQKPSKVVVVEENNLPPGQVKKIYGRKSAKYYTPGQNNKHKQ